MFKNIVLKNRLKQEEDKEILYSREEVALIIDYNIKIGPPRETKYDEIANMILSAEGKQELLSLYVSPSYPLGKSFDYYINNPEIEKYGLTPYKAGSNRLQEYRLVFGKVSRYNLEKMIKNSFVPFFDYLPNSVKDLYIVIDLIKRIIEQDYDFESYADINVLQEDILSMIDKFLPELYE